MLPFTVVSLSFHPTVLWWREMLSCTEPFCKANFSYPEYHLPEALIVRNETLTRGKNLHPPESCVTQSAVIEYGEVTGFQNGPGCGAEIDGGSHEVVPHFV
jgi:hypothetical protein